VSFLGSQEFVDILQQLSLRALSHQQLSTITMPSSEDADRLQLPGFGLPANTISDFWYKGSHPVNTVSLLRYPNAISNWSGDPMTIRVRNMMAWSTRLSTSLNGDGRFLMKRLLNGALKLSRKQARVFPGRSLNM
jgi:hypothetical protein